MTSTLEKERLRQVAVDALAADDFEGIAYDDITRRAAEICSAPVAAITVINSEVQLFRSRIGTDITSRPRELTFCTHALQDQEHITIVEDASQDPRFAANPVVAASPNIRFYAGVPLIYRRQAIGTLCVFDVKPRTLTSAQINELGFLAKQVMATLEARRASE